jgi:hypothetical protein
MLIKFRPKVGDMVVDCTAATSAITLLSYSLPS